MRARLRAARPCAAACHVHAAAPALTPERAQLAGAQGTAHSWSGAFRALRPASLAHRLTRAAACAGCKCRAAPRASCCESAGTFTALRRSSTTSSARRKRCVACGARSSACTPPPERSRVACVRRAGGVVARRAAHAVHRHLGKARHRGCQVPGRELAGDRDSAKKVKGACARGAAACAPCACAECCRARAGHDDLVGCRRGLHAVLASVLELKVSACVTINAAPQTSKLVCASATCVSALSVTAA